MKCWAVLLNRLGCLNIKLLLGIKNELAYQSRSHHKFAKFSPRSAKLSPAGKKKKNRGKAVEKIFAHIKCDLLDNWSKVRKTFFRDQKSKKKNVNPEIYFQCAEKNVVGDKSCWTRTTAQDVKAWVGPEHRKKISGQLRTFDAQNFGSGHLPL